MKIAILDALPERYWQDDGGYTDGEKFRDLLSPVLPDAHFDIYYVTKNQWPDDINSYQGIVASGSAASVHDRAPWIRRLKQILQQACAQRLKIIGICFSHQLIATMFGGEVSKNEHGWMIGNFELTIDKSLPWMRQQATRSCIHHFNEERVTRLPDNAESFAHSEQYDNVAYTIDDYILCVQGHPEQSTQSVCNWLTSMEGQMPDDEYSKAWLRAESGNPDRELWANWFAEFLQI